ncbi:hypothetical protein HPP92_013501 [Vanilla planifolia]|uniref:SEC63 domain-containing protein n=1 Tax=Vanilla planifolia TaxID=51239 RepID=A0A835QNK2_VANPL|nr:hypothetical protein HPP92_013501 [Vanilla planifolia]
MTELLIHAHLTRAAAELYSVLHKDYRRMLEVAPRLLEELMKIAVKPRSPHGHGWLKPAVGVLQLAQCITQAVPLSARKASGGIAPFLQLPHLNETKVKKIVPKKVCSLGEFRGLSMEERKDLLTEIAGLSAAESQDVESVLEMIPSVEVEITCVTEGEKCIHEGDLVTVYAWIILQRNNGLKTALPHAPYYPFHKEENYWFLLADSVTNKVWMSRKVSFMDEASAISAASIAMKEANESLGFSSKDVDAAVRAAIGKVKSGSRLVMGTFRAPREGKYNLIAYCFCDSWIGCDVERAVKLEVLKGNRAGKRGWAVEERALGKEDVEEGEEEDVIQEGDDHASDYSDECE